jgi:hypothetical protein
MKTVKEINSTKNVVIGGTGLVGTKLVRELRDRGHIALSDHTPSTTASAHSLPFYRRKGTRRTPASGLPAGDELLGAAAEASNGAPAGERGAGAAS